MNDRSSARHTQHAKTPQPVVRKIVHLRWKQHLGPVQIGAKLDMPASTVHAALVRCGLNRLTYIDRVTGEPLRRYEHPYPGSLIHVDVSKFGNIPDSGEWRLVGKPQGFANRRATRDRTGIKARKCHPKVGTCFVHTIIDDWVVLTRGELGVTARSRGRSARSRLVRAVHPDPRRGRLPCLSGPHPGDQ